jgi:hypothetical protein
VKSNAIAGWCFESWSAFEAHFDSWKREIADKRTHGTTGDAPIDRFRHAEAAALRPIAGIPSFAVTGELLRKVQAGCAIEVDGNAYSVPWRLIGETVRLRVTSRTLRVTHAGDEVEVHQCSTSRFERLVDPLHFEGVVGFYSKAGAVPRSDPAIAVAGAFDPSAAKLV